MRKLISALLAASALLMVGAKDDAHPKEIATDSGVVMLVLPGGAFTMGDKDGGVSLKPHKVTVSSFCMDKTPVTQAEYEQLMGDNPSRWKNPDNPVEQISWAGAVRYCNERSRMEGRQYCYDPETFECNFQADGYRLPTEAEWEYACRAGTTTKYFFYDKPNKLEHFGWYEKNSAGKARPVAQKLPNPWRLLDMCGGVWEWCNDWFKTDYYAKSPTDNPKGPAEGEYRVVRGGSWKSKAEECASAQRHRESPGYGGDVCIVGYDIYGFRCVRKP